jgi:hypothetical protein
MLPNRIVIGAVADTTFPSFQNLAGISIGGTSNLTSPTNGPESYSETMLSSGRVLDAAARVLVYIGKAQHRIEKSTFDALRKLLLALDLRQPSAPGMPVARTDLIVTGLLPRFSQAWLISRCLTRRNNRLAHPPAWRQNRACRQQTASSR